MSREASRVIFPSLHNAYLPKDHHIGYTIHSDRMDLWDQCRQGWPLCEWAGFFLTYGDGMIQHSHESAVQVDKMVDFCLSLTKYILGDNRDSMEAWRILARHLDSEVSAERVKFALTVQYKEGKTRYYSMTERKVSASDSKRHDKRWEKIEDWMDGSVTATYRLIRGQGHYDKFLDCYRMAHETRELCQLLTGTYGPLPTEMLGAADRFDDWVVRDQFDAFRSIHNLAKAWRHRDYSERLANCLQGNIESREQARTKKEAEATASTAAGNGETE